MNSDTTTIAARLAALRGLLRQEKLHGFIVPMADEFQNEYVPPSARRLEFMTGFTGSAGAAAILEDQAGFFTDSRYILQAQNEVPGSLYERLDSAATTPDSWLGARLRPGQRLGYDPWLHSVRGLERLQQAAVKAGAALVATARNPVDAIWSDRPAVPCAPVVPYGIEFAGQSSDDKRRMLAETLRVQSCAAAVISDPASAAWLLNIRGGDVPHTPLPLGFALLHDDASVDWFVDARKLTKDLPAHLGAAVRISPIEDFVPGLAALGARRARVSLDPDLCAAFIAQTLQESGAVIAQDSSDPCALPRACKNPAEQQGMRAAHRRDGVALAQFFAWLALQPPGSVGELQAETMLEQCRAAQNLYCGASFPTIAGSGPHGAIVHYRATAASDRILQAGELFLLDSGGQYLDGTTDVTRTVAIDKPSDAMRDRYTRVVKGHIALAAIRFPAGTAGAELDVLARQFLWAAGLDYGHGTGHGVGSYLGVHEGPQSISRRAQNRTTLQPGMVVSNEPGYYKQGAYGIRFENLLLVQEAATVADGEQAMLGFETLTLAPLDRNLLRLDLLTKPELDWINAYHAQVRAALADLLNQDACRWLIQATEAV